MKSFKEYTKETPNILDWESSFAELRDDPNPKEDKKSLKEAKKEDWEGWHGEPRPVKKVPNDYDTTYDSGFHNHPDIEPQNLTPEHQQTIVHYCGTKSHHPKEGHQSSSNVNNYLRNRHGNHIVGIVGGHSESKVLSAVKNLSSVFTKENTNKKQVTTYSGVPKSVGESLRAGGKGSIHHVPGFVSTSASQSVANNFAKKNAARAGTNDRHVIKYTVKPGTGLSVAEHSPYDEDEVLLHHGAKLKYSHTTEHPHEDYRGHKGITYVHHVTAEKSHLSLNDYGNYNHPEVEGKNIV